MPGKSIKKIKITKRPRKRKIKINKLSKKKSKGGSCGLDYRHKRGGQCACSADNCKCMKLKGGQCPCRCGCPHCSKQMKGGALCIGERLHGCLKRETDKNNIRAKPQNGSSENYTLHGKYPRYPQSDSVGDMGRVNKRSRRHEKRIAEGKLHGGSSIKDIKKLEKKIEKLQKDLKKAKAHLKEDIRKKVKGAKALLKRIKGGAKKGQYTKASYKRVKAATPEFAKKHGEVAKGGAKKKRGRPKKKGGASGYKKAKSRVARIGRKAVKPKSLKKKKGGASGYKKSKNRQARINSKQVQPKKPVKDDSKFA